ncbi:FecR family protein [Herbaspirillum robiniae]|uniref:FecR family protein n=1 Tax=Herbaspirillum robiniae TaxID=2014887 RepID=UPI003D779A89
MNKSSDKEDYPDATLEQQAWIWLRLLQSGNARQWDLDGFQRWVRTSSAHQQAFSRARREWEAVDAAAGLHAADVRLNTSGRLNQGRRRVFRFALAGATAAVAGAAVLHPPMGLWLEPAAWGGDSTALGEQRAIGMGDGVQITLNTQTSIRRQSIDGRVRGIELIKGEAAVDLAVAGSPFGVSAGGAKSIAEAGSFEVRYLEEKICVTCLSGEVVVRHAAGERRLPARTQTVYDAARISGIGSIEPTLVSAWRRGELRFDKTPLRAVIAEINRYRPGNVVLMNDAVRNQPVSGSFQIASLDQALVQLQRTFNLRANSLPAGIYLLS